ncbi:hypothetical protein [Nonomuraea sp. NPDC049758]|uniref:hypothetical protein n=1 Tax=Nonomuraea sp. NPDC049758 TaxID=3154360 RepID=UPI00343170A8
MTTTSRIPQAIDNLLALLQAAPGLDGVKVIDGPLVTSDPLKEAVFVGFDGDPDGEGQAVEFTQTWASIGQRSRAETFTIRCAVAVWRGSIKVRPVRVRAFEVLGVVEDVVRASPDLGLPPPTVTAFASGSLVLDQRSTGLECRIPFDIAVQTRI